MNSITCLRKSAIIVQRYLPSISCLSRSYAVAKPKRKLWKNVGWENQFPDSMQPAIFDPKAIAALEESGQLEEQSLVAFRPAQPFETSSVFYDETVSKFTRYLMYSADKARARMIMDKVLYIIKKRQLKEYYDLLEEGRQDEADLVVLDPVKLIKRAVENCRPLVCVLPVRKGGIIYQVPAPVTLKQSYVKSMKWMIAAARDKTRETWIWESFATEIIEAASGKGRVVKKKQDLHRVAEANRAYAHYRN